MDKHRGESTTFELFTTFSDDTLDVERLFQASKRPFPSFSANSHPSVQNRSTLQLIYQRYLALMETKEAAVKPIAETLPDLEWALQILTDLDHWQQRLT